MVGRYEPGMIFPCPPPRFKKNPSRLQDCCGHHHRDRLYRHHQKQPIPDSLRIRQHIFIFSLSLRNGNAMAHIDFIHPSGKPSAAPGFLNKYLEIRENRVNTHRARASRYCKSFNLQILSGKFPSSAILTAARQCAGGHTSYPPTASSRVETAWIFPYTATRFVSPCR